MSTRIEPSEKRQPPFWQNVFVGGVSGITTISIIQWMMYFKVVQQANSATESKFVWNPRVWYRGFGSIAGSFVPTVAVQTAANGIFTSLLPHPILAAGAAGMVSAIIVCPAEGIMIQQQKTGKNFWAATLVIQKQHGYLGIYRAFIPTAMREGSFAASYLGLVPLLKEKFKKQGMNEGLAHMLAGTVSGVFSAVISHPIDVYKTQKQWDLAIKNFQLKALLHAGPFAGLGWRTAIIVTASTVIPFIQENLNAKFK
jgi:hypothetical protein